MSSTDYKVTNDGVVHSYDFITKGPWVDVRAYPTLELANTAAYNAGKILLIAQNYTLTANTTLTASVMRIPGGSFTKAFTYILTFSGKFVNPDNGHCFIGFSPGDVIFGVGLIEEAYAEWFGVNGSTDEVAINCAKASYSVVKLLPKLYKTSAKLSITTNLSTVKGTDIRTVIWGNHSDYVIEVGDGTNFKYGINIENISVWSSLGKGWNFQKIMECNFKNLYSWTAQDTFKIQKNALVNKFDKIIARGQFHLLLMSIYPSLPTVTSTGGGILIDGQVESCNANLFILPVVEGMEGDGIKILGDVNETTIISPTIEGNGGWAIYGDYVIPGHFIRNLKIDNIYSEENLTGGILLKRATGKISGGLLSGTSGNQGQIQLVNIIGMDFEDLRLAGITMDYDCSENNFKRIRYNVGHSLGIIGDGLPHNNQFDLCIDDTGSETKFKSISTNASGDIKINEIGGRGVVLWNAAGDVKKRVRLNDAGDGLIFENE